MYIIDVYICILDNLNTIYKYTLISYFLCSIINILYIYIVAV